MSNCEWTVDTLKQHFEALRQADQMAVDKALASLEKLLSTMHAASQEAITKAEEAQLRYNQGHNDLQHKMEEQYKRMMPREESLANYKNVNEKVDTNIRNIGIISSKLDEMRGKGAGAWQLILVVVALLTIAGFIITQVNK